MRLTIACPQAHIADANQLAMVLGYSEADKDTYREPQWQDAQGNLYSLASLPVSEGFIGAATSALQRPEWDTDNTVNMAGAARAQALVSLWMATEEAPTPPIAAPDIILAMVGDDPLALVAAAGLTQVQLDSDDTLT